VSGPVFMFCMPGLIFGGTKGIGVMFSYFALMGMFLAFRRASGLDFMFCVPGLVFGDTKGVDLRIHVLRSQTRFRRYRGRRVLFSYFALLNSFSAVPRASGPVLMFCAPGIIFGGVECVGSRFHVLRAYTHFRQYQGRPIPFSCFSLPDMFLAVRRESSPIFMFCAPRHISRGTEGVESRFHVLISQTLFRRYRGRRVPFSCFARPDSFSAKPRASTPVFFSCAPGHVFGGTKGVGSRFHVLSS
jgi:hypothetical protein